MPNTAAWIDTGFLVALFTRDDRNHESATGWLRANATIPLHTLWPVIVEAAFFLDVSGQAVLLTWLERGAVTLTTCMSAIFRQFGPLWSTTAICLPISPTPLW